MSAFAARQPWARIAAAHFPTLKTIESFDFTLQLAEAAGLALVALDPRLRARDLDVRANKEKAPNAAGELDKQPLATVRT